MARTSLLVCIVLAAVAAGCKGGPAAPSSPPAGMERLAPGRVSMTFIAQDASYEAASAEYHRIWSEEGTRIVDAMERATGLRFLETNIRAVIFEGVSRSGTGDTPMYLRASYPADVKLSTLVHENGHRLIAQLRDRPSDLDEHRVLNLFLYDVWESLWGKAFADARVASESALTGLYDYAGAWRWALSLSTEERASRFAAIVRSNRR